MNLKFLKKKETYTFLKRLDFYLGLVLIVSTGVVIFYYHYMVAFLFPPEIAMVAKVSANYETLKFIVYLIGGLLVVWQVYLTNRRTKAAEDSAKYAFDSIGLLEKGQIQERFKNAIDQLGSEKEAVNLGAIYTLHHVAKESKVLRKSIFDILCSYIRETTSNAEYNTNKAIPIKIQSLLNLLFIDKEERIIYNDYVADLKRVDLSNAIISCANLRAADLEYACLDGADFFQTDISHAILNGASMREANFGSANLSFSSITEADLTFASFYESDLRGADLGGADLTRSQIYSSKLNHTQLNAATMVDVALFQSDLSDASLLSANLNGGHLNDVNLSNAILKDADLSSANLSGANLSHADIRGTTLINVCVKELDWINKLGEMECIGRDEVDKKYKVVSSIDKYLTNDGEFEEKVFKLIEKKKPEDPITKL